MTFPADPRQLTRDEHVRASLAAFRRRSRRVSRARFVRALIEARERVVYVDDRRSVGILQVPAPGTFGASRSRDVGASARLFFERGLQAALEAGKTVTTTAPTREGAQRTYDAALRAVREDHEAGR